MSSHVVEGRRRLVYLALIFGGFAIALATAATSGAQPKTIAIITVIVSTVGVLLSSDDAAERLGRLGGARSVQVTGQLLAIIGWAMALGALLVL